MIGKASSLAAVKMKAVMMTYFDRAEIVSFVIS